MTLTVKQTMVLALIAGAYAGNAIAAEDSDAIASPTNTPIAVRDPFWPVGYRPAVKNTGPQEEAASRIQERTSWPSLKLSGITRSGESRYIAIIEGIGLVETGDIITLRQDNLIYRWRINAVTAEGVSRTRLDVREPIAVLQESD